MSGIKSGMRKDECAVSKVCMDIEREIGVGEIILWPAKGSKATVGPSLVCMLTPETLLKTFEAIESGERRDLGVGKPLGWADGDPNGEVDGGRGRRTDVSI